MEEQRTMLKNGCQDLLKNLGTSGCYFLCLCKIAEEELHRSVDVVDAAYKALENRWIDEEFFIMNPTAILCYLTGKKWTVTISKEMQSADYSVVKYVNGKYTHFRLEDWDSLENSTSVKCGKIDSYRLFKKM